MTGDTTLNAPRHYAQVTMLENSERCEQEHCHLGIQGVLSPSSVSWGNLPTRTTQPTSRIETLTSTFAGLKEDTCTKDALAAHQR
ncbi:hypothetical protein TNCV_668531 [Trichonephila clavipes]|nr:hypothetical protein TNCV_668531 [Trichonephila clavipes]